MSVFVAYCESVRVDPEAYHEAFLHPIWCVCTDMGCLEQLKNSKGKVRSDTTGSHHHLRCHNRSSLSGKNAGKEVAGLISRDLIWFACACNPSHPRKGMDAMERGLHKCCGAYVYRMRTCQINKVTACIISDESINKRLCGPRRCYFT